MTTPTSILPTHEVMFLRGIKKTAVILLLLLRLDRLAKHHEVMRSIPHMFLVRDHQLIH